MNTTILSLALFCIVAPPVKTEKTPQTLLYVRTTPSGAEIRLDGKSLGTSDDLFPVEPGDYKIVIDLEGHQPSKQKITIREGRITRIELELKKGPKTPLSTTGDDPATGKIAPTVVKHSVWSQIVNPFVGKINHRLRSQSRLMGLYGLLMNYAEAHQARYPDNLDQLKAIGKAPGEMKLLEWASKNVQYVAKGETTRENPQRPLAYDRTLLEETGGTNVLFNDGHVEFVPTTERLKYLGMNTEPKPDESKSASFGPVIERVVYDGGSARECGIDFETGKLFMVPDWARNTPGKDPKMLDWVRKNGIDVSGDTSGPITSQGVQGGLGLAAKYFRVGWKLGAAEVIYMIGSSLEFHSLPAEKVKLFVKDALPTTYLFKTREGGMGVLQIVGFTDEPRGVRIRYKMVKPVGGGGRDSGGGGMGGGGHAETQPAARTVHLPDADTKGAEVVLDLASGQTLAISADAEDQIGQFTRLGKGDLMYDRLLGCLRGAKAMRVTDAGIVALLVKDQHEDASAYSLPDVPCRLLITTAEKKQFDVTILSVTDSGGINLEYRPAEVQKSVEPPTP